MTSWTFPTDLLKKIPPYQYLHLLDNNTNVVRLEVGPQTYRCKDQEAAVYGPAKMIVVAPHHYVVIANPVKTTERNGKKEVVIDKFGQAVLRHGDQEVRFEQEPFPLYPGEVLVEKMRPLEIIEANTALLLEATRDFEDRLNVDKDGLPIFRKCGTRWYFIGPGTYIPQPEVVRRDLITATVIKPGQALRLRARRNYTDRNGVKRLTGSEWHHTETGFYLPSIEEEIVKVDQAHILTNKTALHLRALYTFVDCFGIERRAGSEWLVTSNMTESHIPHVASAVVNTVEITTLRNREWIVLQNPQGEDGRPSYGKRLIVRGEKNFFLQPGETIVSGPHEVEVLTAEMALLVEAIKPLTENSTGKRIARCPGEQWYIYGPKEYWPPLEVKIIKKVTPCLQLGTMCFFRRDVLFLFAVFVVLVLFVLWRLFISFTK